MAISPEDRQFRRVSFRGDRVMMHWFTRLATKVPGGRHRPSSAPRRACLSVEALEEREMLSAAPQPVAAPSPAAALVSATADPGARVPSTLPDSPGAAPREGAGDPSPCSPRPAAGPLVEDLCPPPSSGEIFLSLTAGSAFLSLSAGGTEQGRPSPAVAPLDGLGEDLGGDPPSPDATPAGAGPHPAGDVAPRRAAADNSSRLDRSRDTEPVPAVGTKGPASVFDALDDDSDTDDIEEVADMFAEAAEADGSSESICLTAPARPGAGVISW
jgi:hypothetical protein